MKPQDEELTTVGAANTQEQNAGDAMAKNLERIRIVAKWMICTEMNMAAVNRANGICKTIISMIGDIFNDMMAIEDHEETSQIIEGHILGHEGRSKGIAIDTMVHQGFFLDMVLMAIEIIPMIDIIVT